MTHDEAFLRAVREAPDDDAPRLIYADYLEERGDPRAEFIRVQCRLARLPEDDPARPDLEDEEQDLLARHGDEWAAPLPALGARWQFRRGFVEQLSIPAANFLARAEDLFAAHPLRDVEFLHLYPGSVPALAACPHLDWLETIKLVTYLRDPAIQSLLGSPHLGRLTNLTLAGCGIEGPAVQTLVESPLLSRLKRLDFSGNRPFGDRALRILVSSPAVGNLEVLRLANTNLSTTGVLTLFGSPHFARLSVLDVAASLFTRNLTPVFGRLAASPLLTRLRALDLSGSRFGPGGFRISGVPEGAAVPMEALTLRDCGLGPAEARALAEAPYLMRLKELDLGTNVISSEGLVALAVSPYLAGLRALWLFNNAVRDTGARALADSPFLTRLTTLDLSKNGIGGPGVQALVSSPNLAGLRDLDLGENFVGPASVQALADSPYLGNLTRLALGSVHMDPDSARALADSRNLSRLRVLNLEHNPIGDAGVRALAASPHLGRLTELNLTDNRIGKAGAEALAASPHLGRLRRLDLTRNELTQDQHQLVRSRFTEAVFDRETAYE